MKKIINWFVHNSVAANLLMMVFVVGGLLVAPTIPTKLFPDIDFLLATIDVPTPERLRSRWKRASAFQSKRPSIP